MALAWHGPGSQNTAQQITPMEGQNMSYARIDTEAFGTDLNDLASLLDEAQTVADRIAAGLDPVRRYAETRTGARMNANDLHHRTGIPENTVRRILDGTTDGITSSKILRVGRAIQRAYLSAEEGATE